MPPPPERPLRARLAPRLLLAAAGLAVALVLVEVGVRVRLRARGEPFRAERARSGLEVAHAALTQRVPLPGSARQAAPGEGGSDVEVLHPYFGYESLARMRSVAEEAARFRSGGGEDTYDVLVLGGSVAQLVARLGGPRLVELLAGDPRLDGRRPRILNEARPAFKQPQQVMVLAYLLTLGYRPDAVVSIDGYNEVAIGNSNAVGGTHPFHPYRAQWRNLAAGARADAAIMDLALEVRRTQRAAASSAQWSLRLGLHHSAAAWLFVDKRLRRQRTALARAWREIAGAQREGEDGDEVRGPPFDKDPDAVADLLARAWYEGSRMLDALCRARGIRYLHVLQPTLHDEGSKPLTPEELEGSAAERPWTEGVRRGYPRLRELGRRLAVEGVPFLDASRAFAGVEETLYYDACHFGERGCELVAEAAAAALLAAE